jgi:hypothetical protein
MARRIAAVSIVVAAVTFTSCDDLALKGFIEGIIFKAPPVPQPVVLHVVRVTDTSVTLGWVDDALDTAGYRLERKQSVGDPLTKSIIDSGDWVQIVDLPQGETVFEDDNLDAGTASLNYKYHYRIRSYNESGISEYSDAVSIFTLDSDTTLDPYVKIVSPAHNETTSSSFFVQFDIDWFVEPGGGTHIHFYVDGDDYLGAYYSIADIPIGQPPKLPLSPGRHRMTIRLANWDHTFFGVSDTVEIVVEDP